MKCPYRKIIVHRPEVEQGYVVSKGYLTECSKDIEQFADCYEGACPFYEPYHICKKVESEKKNDRK